MLRVRAISGSRLECSHKHFEIGTSISANQRLEAPSFRAGRSHRKTKEILPQKWRGRISILAKTPDEFEAVLPSLYLEIALDGLILYDPKEYAAVQLLKLRRLIQAKDLRREKRGCDFIWQWGTFPDFGWSLAWKEAT